MWVAPLPRAAAGKPARFCRCVCATHYLARPPATASNNAWPVGDMCATSVCGVNKDALILHWNGTAWTTSSG
jgi:hypothetical protein